MIFLISVLVLMCCNSQSEAEILSTRLHVSNDNCLWNADNRDANFGADKTVRVGITYRAVLSFESLKNHPRIDPTVARLLNATLVLPLRFAGYDKDLPCDAPSDTRGCLDVYILQQPWGEGRGVIGRGAASIAQTGESSWIYSSRPTNWTIPGGGTFDENDAIGSLSYSFISPLPGDPILYLEIPMNAGRMQSILKEESSFYGFIIVNNENPAHISIVSEERSQQFSTLGPHLALTWHVPDTMHTASLFPTVSPTPTSATSMPTVAPIALATLTTTPTVNSATFIDKDGETLPPTMSPLAITETNAPVVQDLVTLPPSSRCDCGFGRGGCILIVSLASTLLQIMLP